MKEKRFFILTKFPTVGIIDCLADTSNDGHYPFIIVDERKGKHRKVYEFFSKTEIIPTITPGDYELPHLDYHVFHFRLGIPSDYDEYYNPPICASELNPVKALDIVKPYTGESQRVAIAFRNYFNSLLEFEISQEEKKQEEKRLAAQKRFEENKAAEQIDAIL